MVDSERIILRLHEIGAIKFGEFRLKSGILSPIYVDLRLCVSYPDLLREISEIMWKRICHLKFDIVCGVPYTALPIATSLCLDRKLPMVMRRKEVKAYGTKRAIEGEFQSGQTCLIVEDLITSGTSVLETSAALEREGLVVRDAVLLLDREQGGVENLKARGLTVHAVFTATEMIDTLEKSGRLTAEMAQLARNFLAENRKVSVALPKELSYGERAGRCPSPIGQRLFELMEHKRTNLSFNPDVTSQAELLRLADLVGPEICMLKTHVDILTDFDPSFGAKLQQLAEKHNFLIFEDRKFADIGSVVKQQYSKGIYAIAEWADITNAHLVPGPGIIDGLKEVGLPLGRGLLLLAEMSSRGTLATGSYTEQVVAEAEKHREFVIGFVAMQKLTDDPGMIHLTPGVQLETGKDDLGQQFKTPYSVIVEKGSDIIQVGRGIYGAKDPLAAAKEYRQEGWRAYQKRLGRVV
jgi:uridine monophosphate synthetase